MSLIAAESVVCPVIFLIYAEIYRAHPTSSLFPISVNEYSLIKRRGSYHYPNDRTASGGARIWPSGADSAGRAAAAACCLWHTASRRGDRSTRTGCVHNQRRDDDEHLGRYGQERRWRARDGREYHSNRCRPGGLPAN